MAEQAKKTMHSLNCEYQLGVSAADYEVIVVENSSSNNLSEADVKACGENFHYIRRQEALPTPVFAINHGASKATGTHICVMIDGARLVSPGIVNYMLAAARLAKNPVIAAPGYHLGPKLQRISIQEGYCPAEENRLLSSIQWPLDGYRLFEISCLSGTSRGGFFKPMGESNCICVSKAMFDQLKGFDEKFTETGGGQVNLDFYKRAVEVADSSLIVLLGEGSFHQLHGGITTDAQGSHRRQSMLDHFAQYVELRGAPYQAPNKRPIYLGTVPDSALEFIQTGAAQGLDGYKQQANS
jgi:hypothetical protein